MRTPVTATNIATGEQHTYKSMRAAASLGGWDYTSIKNCVRGFSPSHAGFLFKAQGKLRRTKPNNLMNRVAALRNKGMSNGDIASHLGVTKATVGVYGTLARNAGLTKTYWEICDDLGIQGRSSKGEA